NHELTSLPPLRLGYRHRSEPLQPVRPCGKQRCPSASPLLARGHVIDHERLISHERLHPSPLAPRRDPRSQVAPGLVGLGLIPPRLRENAPATEHSPAGTLSLDDTLKLLLANAALQFGNYVGTVA